MNLKCLTSLVFGVTLALVSTVANAQSSPTNTTPAVMSTNCAEFAERATFTDLVQEIAQLEVERVILGVKFTQDYPEFALLNEKQLGLEVCLTQLQPNDSHDLVVAATISAIESKIEESEKLYINNQNRYFNAHPEQQYLKVVIEALRQHLTTLL